ncbi:MAG: cupin domain-containing protein [Candidatus Rokuibacteriota bacterium]
MVAPADLKWADVPSRPPGAKAAVIEGPMNEAKSFTMRLPGDKLDPKATRALGPGSVAIMQPGRRHFAWTKDETIVQVHGVGPWTVTYPAEDPSKK